MKSSIARRGVFLAVSALAVLVLFALASGLRAVSFAEPRQFNRAEAEEISASMAALVEQLAAVPTWKQVIFWVGIYLLVLIVTSILSPELRKRLLWAVARLAILWFAVLYLVKNRERFGLPDFNPLSLGASPGSPPVVDLAPPVFVPPVIPPALAYLVSAALILLLIGFLWFFGRGFLAHRARPARDPLLDEIASLARSSLDELGAGRDWEESILQCYMRMTEVVARKRGHQRELGMTPSEFALHLEGAGLPARAVHGLTHLFESVRYGAQVSNPPERAEAVDCLHEVLRYCGEPG